MIVTFPEPDDDGFDVNYEPDYSMNSLDSDIVIFDVDCESTRLPPSEPEPPPAQ